MTHELQDVQIRAQGLGVERPAGDGVKAACACGTSVLDRIKGSDIAVTGSHSRTSIHCLHQPSMQGGGELQPVPADTGRGRSLVASPVTQQNVFVCEMRPEARVCEVLSQSLSHSLVLSATKTAHYSRLIGCHHHLGRPPAKAPIITPVTHQSNCSFHPSEVEAGFEETSGYCVHLHLCLCTLWAA